MNRPLFLAALYLGICHLAVAQIDTIVPANNKLILTQQPSITRSYVVYFTDSLGNRTSSADIWDREMKPISGPSGEQQYLFDWKWYKKDSLVSHTKATCRYPSLQPVKYEYYRDNKVMASVLYNSKQVTVKTKSRVTLNDTTFQMTLQMDAFVFPMDMEVFASLPFKNPGQQFVIPFYEPGSPAAGYHTYTYAGKEDVVITTGITIPCWVLKSDQAPNGYSLFYIAQKGREVIKMKQFSKGFYRYKVKLY